MAKKRQPPQVIFWPEHGSLWAWNRVPIDPRLEQLFGWLLWKIGKQGYLTVTVLEICETHRGETEGRYESYPCRALKFSVGGLQGKETEAFTRYVNGRWIQGGAAEGSGKRPGVLLYYGKAKNPYFEARVNCITRPAGKG